MIVQDLYDRARYSEVEDRVYSSSASFGAQNYWLARCFITLADSFAAQGKNAQAKATLDSVRTGYDSADDDIMSLVTSRLTLIENQQ